MHSENVEMDEQLSEDPENITLTPSEERSAKARCTIRTSRIKQEQDSDEEGELINAEGHKNQVYVMEIVGNNVENEAMKLQQVEQRMSE